MESVFMRGKKLCSAPDFFAERFDAGKPGAVSLLWTMEHSRVEAGRKIGDWILSTGAKLPIVAPEGCTGEVVAFNDNKLKFFRLHLDPEQELLEIE